MLRVLLAGLLLGFTGSAVVSAGEETAATPAEAFHEAAERLYEAAKAEAPGEVLRRLREVEGRLRELPMRQVQSAEAVEALADSVAEMKRAAAGVSPDPQQWEAAAARVRLAADALAHRERPMWHRYRPLLREDIARMEEALRPTYASRSGVKDALAAFDRLQARYRMIRTAALLHQEPWIVERSDSVMTYAGRLLRAPQTDPELLRAMFAPLRQAIDGLFPGDQDRPSAAMPTFAAPPWGVTAAIGSFIVSVLAWSGWRRFRWERSRLPGGRRRGEPPRDAAERWLRR